MRTKPKKIIVVEDDPALQHAMELIFERGGYDVSILATGEEALDPTLALPDIFVLDKQLSGIDGLDICRFLKSQAATADIPVIMLSANPAIGRLSQEAGATDFLEKPFKLKNLLELVEKYA